MKLLSAVYRHPLLMAGGYTILLAAGALLAWLQLPPALPLCSTVDPVLGINVPCSLDTQAVFAGPAALLLTLLSIGLVGFPSVLLRFVSYMFLWRRYNLAAIPMGIITLMLEVLGFFFILGIYTDAFNGTSLGGVAVLVMTLLHGGALILWGVVALLLYMLSRGKEDQR
jgi:hypothetical protein